MTPKIFIVQPGKLISVEKVTMEEPYDWGRYSNKGIEGALYQLQQNEYDRNRCEEYEEHLASGLVHNSPQLQELITEGQELVEGVEVEIEYQIRIRTDNQWTNCDKDEFDDFKGGKYDGNFRRIVLTPIEGKGVSIKDEHIDNMGFDSDPICVTELFKKLKWEVGSIQFNHLSMSSDGKAIEANPSTHRIAKYIYSLLSTPPVKPSEGLREALEKIVDKYKKYLDNIVWHITTNQPKGTEAEICHKRVDDYTEILNDLHSLIKQ